MSTWVKAVTVARRQLRRYRRIYRVISISSRSEAVKWSAISSLSSSIASASSIHSMLSALNVIQTMGAVITHNYVGKDIIGQVGILIYSLRKGRRADTAPDIHIKRGLTVQYAAYAIEGIAPFLISLNPLLFLPVTGLSNIGKNLGWITLGAINAKVINKVGDEHIGEMYSRMSAINTIASSVGLTIGLITVAAIPSHTVRSAVVVPICGIIHWYASKRLLTLIK